MLTMQDILEDYIVAFNADEYQTAYQLAEDMVREKKCEEEKRQKREGERIEYLSSVLEWIETKLPLCITKMTKEAVLSGKDISNSYTVIEDSIRKIYTKRIGFINYTWYEGMPLWLLAEEVNKLDARITMCRNSDIKSNVEAYKSTVYHWYEISIRY